MKRRILCLILFLFLCSCGNYNDPADIKEPLCIIHLPAIDIYVAEDCINYEGLAWLYDKKICVRGKFLVDGMVDPNDDTLGHEIQHLMHMYNKRIVDPDK